METTLDRFGRILIPKKVRDDLDLKPGSRLRIDELEGKILLKPVRGESHVVVKEGVLVFTGPAKGDIVGAVRAVREERLKKLKPRPRR